MFANVAAAVELTDFNVTIPVASVKVKVFAPVKVTLTFSTFINTGVIFAAKAVTFNVSVPAPPSIESAVAKSPAATARIVSLLTVVLEAASEELGAKVSAPLVSDVLRVSLLFDLNDLLIILFGKTTL